MNLCALNGLAGFIGYLELNRGLLRNNKWETAF